MLYSDTYHADTATTDSLVVFPTNEKSRQLPLTTTHASTVRQSSKAASTERYADFAVKRRQIGQKRKSLQEMRHLLNTATITVFVSVILTSCLVMNNLACKRIRCIGNLFTEGLQYDFRRRLNSVFSIVAH